MTEVSEPTQPVQSNGQPDNTPPTGPSSTPSQGGQTTTVETAPLDPSLQGKSPQEIATMYVELQKKLGENSGELGELRKYRGQMDVVLQAVYSDPELFKSVESKVLELTGQKTPEVKEPDKKTEVKEAPADTDTRKAVEASILSNFETEYGINRLPENQRKDMMIKVGNALANMVDPMGNKTYQEVLNSISLQKLPVFLKNSYLIANADQIVEKARQDGERKAVESATFGSIPSSSVPTEDVSLTAEERETARKMNIPEDKYLARKKEILAAPR